METMLTLITTAFAVIVTTVAVVVTVLLARIAGKMGIDLDKE